MVKANEIYRCFTFIDNLNITKRHIWKDRIHLNDLGTIILMNSFISAINGERTDWIVNKPQPTPVFETHITNDIYVGVMNDSNLYDIVEINDISDPNCVLKSIKNKSNNRLVIGSIHINRIHKKFDSLVSMIKGVINILIITETKIDNSFPTQQYLIDDYASPFRLDRNKKGES